MDILHKWIPSEDELQELRVWCDGTTEVVPFHLAPHTAAKIAALGMSREVGTQNDEMARFLFDRRTGDVVRRQSLHAELVTLGSAVGVRIWSEDSDDLEIRFRGVIEYINPKHSYGDDGRLKQIVVFPEAVAKILNMQQVTPVIVRPWARNTIFGGFDPATDYYQTNMWELSNNDTIRFSALVANRQVPFLGSHDFIAHIAGTDGERWPTLQRRGEMVHELLTRYFKGVDKPDVTSLVLPYVAGVLLDDLAQPSSYDDETRIVPLELVCEAIESMEIDPKSKHVLTKFPANFERLIDLARFQNADVVRQRAKEFVAKLATELRQTSLVY
jgi:hypothetical protein